MNLKQNLSWKLLLPIGIALLSSFAWFYLSESIVSFLALVGFVMVLAGTVDLIKECKKDAKNISYLVLFVFIFLVLILAPWMTNDWSKKQLLGLEGIDNSWNISARWIPFGRFITAYEPGPSSKSLGLFVNLFGVPMGKPVRYGDIELIGTKTQDASSPEGEKQSTITEGETTDGEGSKEEIVRIIDDKGVETYSLGTSEFKIYPLIQDLETKKFRFGFFEAYNKGEKIYTSEQVYKIYNLFSFEHGEIKYIVINEYSGGAHCCFTTYVFSLDGKNNLNLIKTLPLGNTSVREENLFIKNGDLYLEIYDDRFAYFHTAYAGSYFFKQYLLMKEDEIIRNNDIFKENYINEAERCANELGDLKSSEQQTKPFETWFPLLVCRTVNYMLSGEVEKTWQGFEDYFVDPSDPSPEIIKAEIVEKMNQDRF